MVQGRCTAENTARLTSDAVAGGWTVLPQGTVGRVGFFDFKLARYIIESSISS